MSSLGNLNDPWIAPPGAPDGNGQSGRVKAYCKIIVAGLDVTDRLWPYLLSVEVHDGASDSQGLWAQIELDDREGQLPIPPPLSPVSIVLGWVGGESRMWNLQIFDIISSFQRHPSSGRQMQIQCYGGDDQYSAQKTPMNDHLGEGAPPGSEIGLPIQLGQWLSQVAGNAGGTAYVHPSLAGITRDYWHMAGESPIHHFNRVAQEFGAVTRVESGANFVMTLPGQNWDGSTPPTVTAEWGANLIAWRIHPWIVRSTWASSEHEYFDAVQGIWGSAMDNSFGLPAPWGNGSSLFRPPLSAPNSQAASQRNDGVSSTVAYTAGGNGLITMNGEPAAAWNGFAQLIGARPGVDGLWRIIEAEHTFSRAGYVTYLTVSPEASATGPNSVSAGYPQPASPAPPNPYSPTAEEWEGQTSGVTYPPNPSPNQNPATPAPSTQSTQGTPTASTGQVTIGPIQVGGN